MSTTSSRAPLPAPARRRRPFNPRRAGAWALLVLAIAVSVLPFLWVLRTALSTNSSLASQSASLLPADWDGATPPPGGSPNYHLEAETSTTLQLFKFHVDFVTPGNSTFTGPTNLTVASYTTLCPFTRACGAGVKSCGTEIPRPIASFLSAS